jgi:SAM-dependent methyltransferase
MTRPNVNVAQREHRLPLRGVLQIVRFNWPQYAAGFAASVAALLLAYAVEIPPLTHGVLLSGAVAALWWLVASLVASYWIYDWSPLTRWAWLARHLELNQSPARILNIHSGYDDTTAALRPLFPHAAVVSIDLFDPGRMTERSLRRARRAWPPPADAIAATADRLPLDDGMVDAAVLLLAAHELRAPHDRESLFWELCRIIKTGGRVVLVEHARDASNFVAFGPGFMHFLPFGEWKRLARLAGLHLVEEGRITPFVRFLVLQR